MHPFKRTLLSLLIVSLIASLILPGYLSLAQGKKVVITIMGMEGQPWVPKELREWIKHYIESKLPNVEIKFIGMPLSVDVYHQKLVTLLTAKSPEPDIFAIDVIWPAELVEAGWVEPLNKYVTPEFRAKFIKPLFDSYVYKGVITGIRFMADAAGLYVRKDLLDEFGFKPPKTYYELVKEARAILKKYPNMYGFVWQGAKYEGLVCAWLEFHYAFGSKFFDKNGNVVINSPQGVKALQFMVDLIYKYKVTPKAVTTWKEEDTRIAFTEGKAIFLRNWPYVAGIASDPKRSKVVGKWIIST